ncbi:hypothetical protein HKCCE3408_09870 [Rhodobacterales bacterium HKCCE3408]|nr:hypothetical protein [Rhodobacterales bacterium HKCCE3408]
MSFVRPEVARLIQRWREPIAALLAAALGLWIASRPGGPVLPAAGWALVAIAAVFLPVAIRRARFTATGDGPGVVTLTEGRVTYMGPYDGGTVSLDEIRSLGIGGRRGERRWLLREGAERLEIPVDALGAEVLFDAFSRLPGLNSARLIEALEASEPASRILWQRPDARALTPPDPRSTS